MLPKLAKVVGIDLAGSEKRNTGFCRLEGNHAEVSVLHTDDEILQACGEGVRVAAIDAPLSLPRGRCCLRDNCPCMGKAHFRVCDLELRAMKIKFFPITLGPMRQLTLRGLGLKEKLERRGVHPLKGPCQEEKLILCEKNYFLAELLYRVTAISTFAEISFKFRLQPSLHQSPIRIKVTSGKRL